MYALTITETVSDDEGQVTQLRVTLGRRYLSILEGQSSLDLSSCLLHQVQPDLPKMRPTAHPRVLSLKRGQMML